MKETIDFYFDFSSPYGYLASERIEAALKKEMNAVKGDDARWLVQTLLKTKVEIPGLGAILLSTAGDDAVLLDHGQGLYTLYFHMTELQVKTGETVTRGQQLGTICATGRVTGPHLHFAVKYAGTYVNPADLLAYNPQAILGPAAAEVPAAEELQAAEGEPPTGRR